MVKKILTISLLVLFSLTAFAQDRALLRIGTDGKQEAIPLKKGEKASDVIQRLENTRVSMISKSSSAGLVDSLKYYPGVANQPVGVAPVNTNFGWTHQDVAFIWFKPEAPGVVKEFWWLNWQARGNIKKGTIRAWYTDAKLETFPAANATKHLGYYLDPTDGDANAQPFKPATGNQWFYGNGAADSATYRVDPFKAEAAWLPSGLQQTLDSAKWQGLKLLDWGDSMKVNIGEHFGFTLSNDTKLSDIPGGGTDERMEILSWAKTDPAPFHSYKYYETGRTAASNRGWHLRGDYEWGMYVVIEYTGDRAPKMTVPNYSTTLKTTPRPLTVTVTDDNPGGGAAGVASARLFTKKGKNASYDSTSMTGTGSSYVANAPAASPGDTVYWYVAATDVNGNRTQISPRTYLIFKKSKSRLLVYNNAQYSLGTANLIYTNSSPGYDRWSSVNDGTGELGDLLALFDNVLLGDGSFPARDVFPMIKTWIATGTPTAKKTLFFSSQDYGCFVESNCADTTFVAGSFEYDYLGVEKIGPQDMPPTAREFKIVPQADTVTNYMIKYNSDSGTTLWYDPTFELGFAGYQDAMTPRATAKSLLKDAGTNTVAVKHLGATFNTMYMGVDAGALQFRTDTSKSPGTGGDKYAWIIDVLPPAEAFFRSVLSVQPVSDVVPGEFSLGQNYPNPFNPATTIEYNVPVRSNVQIAIYNILGQKVATIMNDTHEAGTHRATWNGKDQFGKSVASGIYFYQMRAGSFEQVKKMMLMK